ncbi:MAG: DEAD/DEAH box helicase [Thermofilaceae archaeon]
MVLDTKSLLDTLGYSYYSYEEEGAEPERVNVTFADLLPALSKTRLGSERLYMHQLEALSSLDQGFNVVMVAGTGSGKTEAWFLHTSRKNAKTLAIYPTLALANDQMQRLNLYCSLLGAEMVQIDAPSLQTLGIASKRALRERIGRALIVVSNPAFLLQDLKRYASSSSRSFIVPEIHKFSLLVLDELDFYSPRELALIIGMLRVLSELGWKPQVAVLTATLSNPEEMGEVLKEVTNHKYAVVRGTPFRVPNKLYVVLGKNLDHLRSQILEKIGDAEQLQVGQDIKKALQDPEEFRKNSFKVVVALRSLGIEVAAPHTDPLEILAGYVNDDGVTLAFTKSIGAAEEVARRLKIAVGQAGAAIATHHHLISKEERVKVEEGARKGLTKIIFTPRTLVQGIDIGTVVRVVHIGLPDDVREFWQREGRKGRRKEIPFSETVIIPYTRWDHELLERGFNALREWLSLPLEKTVVNRDNKYTMLFTGLFKIIINRTLGLRVSEEELRLLSHLNLAKGGELTARGKRTWQRLNFYEFGPPYGVKRVKITENGYEYLQEASHVDVVEKLQPGCFDYTSDFLVTNLKVSKGRWVTLIEEERPTLHTIYKHEFLAMAYEEYRRVKNSWGEEGNFWRDYLRGLLRSEVICTLHPPTEGFGLYLEIPYRVIWISEGERVRSKVVDKKTHVYRPRRAIDVPSTTMGRYEDYSYGRLYELDPSMNLELARLSLALTKTVLRKVFSIGLKRISYDLSAVGGRKILVLFEDDAAGLIERLDWLQVKKAVEQYEPSELDEVLIESMDDISYAKLVEVGFRWDLAKVYALAILDTILASEKVRVNVRGLEIHVPRPSKALKLLALDTLALPLTENGDVILLYLTLYDGESEHSFKLLKEFYLVDPSSAKAIQTIADYINKGYKILVYSSDRVFRELSDAGLTGLKAMLTGLNNESKLLDVVNTVKQIFNVSLGADELSSYIGFKTSVTLDDVRREYEESLKKIRNLPYSKWIFFTQYLSKKAEKYLEERTKHIYMLNLALEQLKDKYFEQS